MKTDVAVIGAGTGGLVAALKLAQRGLGVVVAEASPEGQFGNTWCNDLDLEPFETFDLPRPLPGELAFPVNRVMRANSTGDRTSVVIGVVPNYSLRVSLYQRRMVELCRTAGVSFLFGSRAVGFLTKGGFVTGVSIQKDKGRKLDLRARMVIAACGAFAPLLKNLPEFCDFRIHCPARDSVSAVQELWEIDRRAAAEKVRQGLFHDNEMVFYLGVPGGGGFSTFMYQLDLDQGVAALLAGCKPQNPGVRTPRQLIDDFKDNRLGFCKRRIYGGGRAIPMRLPLYNLVDNGIALVGDAAFMASPSNGSGTTPSMAAAAQCAETAARVLGSGQTPSKENLWSYNAAFQTGLGATFAGYYAGSRILDALSGDEVQKALEAGLISPRNFRRVHDAQPLAVSLEEALGLAGKALPLLGMLTGFVKHGIKVPIIMRHYARYPRRYDPQAFSAWRARARRILARLD